MQPCSKCGATGTSPCVTASGKPATSWHKARTQVTRSPRHLENTVATAAASAEWITDADQPKVDLALTLARKLDDRIWHAEHVAADRLFPDAPLGELEGGITYDAEVLGRMLDSLGLSPKGRRDLNLPENADDDDDLARILELAAQ